MEVRGMEGAPGRPQTNPEPEWYLIALGKDVWLKSLT